jgi:hypothetical protein
MTTADATLVMISAMYENGGNTVHRFLDGHPQLSVYPFESQLGTALVADALSSMFPNKYRWPVFPLSGTPAQDYSAIIDEECRVRTRTPHVSKFRHVELDLSHDERGALYRQYVCESGRSTGNNVLAFFRATFDAWKNRQRSGQERVFVGYSPAIAIDADRIFADLPNAHLLHVVRHPWSAYADTKRRPVPLPLDGYMLRWNICQMHALRARALFPGRAHVVRIEDVMANPRGTLGPICEAMGLDTAETLARPTWNGQGLDEIYPWGTIRQPTLAANREAADSLSDAERGAIALWASPYLETLDYR